MPRNLFFLGWALLTGVGALPAQDSANAVVPGRLIRIRLSDGAKTEGTVVAVDSARLRLFVTSADTLSFSREEVTRIDLYQGIKSSVGKSALTGALIGAGVGALLGALSASSTEESVVEYSAGQGAAAFGLTFGVLGAGIGALIGTKERPRWRTVDWPVVIVGPASPQ